PRPQVPVAAGTRTAGRRSHAHALPRDRRAAGLRPVAIDPHAAHHRARGLSRRGSGRGAAVKHVTLADINREAYILFAAGATVAWQMARPGVGRGVARHSRTLERPLDRLHATMAYVYAVTLGTDA